MSTTGEPILFEFGTPAISEAPKKLRKLQDLDVKDKRVLIRVDIDVPDNIDGASSLRLQAMKASVDYCMANGAAKIVLLGHIGRPDVCSLTDEACKTHTTERLETLLEDILGYKVEFMKKATKDRQAVMLFDNVRFWKGEQENDLEFANLLASHGDVYVNDSFANSHRDHTSMTLLPKLMPSGAGIHLQEEIKQLSSLFKNPKSPLVAIIGGAKVKDKVAVIDHLAKVADYVLVGGKLPKEIATTGKTFPANVFVSSLTEDGFDIDEISVNTFLKAIQEAGTIIWNGAQGLFEKGYTKGTDAVADAIAASSSHSIVGGGETIQYLAGRNMLNQFSFVSTGGGALLEFLSGEKLPAIAALEI